MAIENNFDIVLTSAQRDALRQELATLEGLFNFTLTLSPRDRKELVRGGPASESFMQGSLQLAKEHPEILPRDMDVEAMSRDMDVRPFLTEMRNRVATLLVRIDDTAAVCGSEAYQAALQVYRSARTNGQGMGLDEHIEELSRRFKQV